MIDNGSCSTYLSEDLDKSPILDVWLLVGGEDKDLPAEWAHSDQAAIMVPSEALDTGKNSISNSCLSLSLCVHLYD